MNAQMEYRLKEAARRILEQARDGDWGHTLRAVNYGKYLLQHEKGDPEIVIPALYLHDIGWSKVDYSDFKHASPYHKNRTASAKLHMRHGAEMAAEILGQMGFDRSIQDTVVAIIAIHDDPDAVFAMGDPSAILVLEADRLDRFGLESLKRYKAMFDPSYLTGSQLEAAKRSRQEGLKDWFRTRTAIALATELIEEMGWSA